MGWPIGLRFLVVCLVVSRVAAAASPDIRSSQRLSELAWPEGDALFHQDARWLGADDAYSVDLGNERVLWLFADTFVATTPAHIRRESKMIRNTVAIERGYDPSKAMMKFYWRSADQSPMAFFPEGADGWYWPGDGIRVGPVLLVFLMRVQGTAGGVGFVGVGWNAVLVSNPDAEPAAWRMDWLDCPQNPFGVVIGSAGVLRQGGYIYAFGSHEPAVHDIFVVRWPASAVLRGDLRTPEWWDVSESSWIAQHDLQKKPQPVFRNGTTEFTVHFDPRAKAFVEIQSEGFDSAGIGMRMAPALTGPWSDLRSIYRPPEADLPGVFNYAAKAHPELSDRDGDLIVTYMTNATKFSRLVADGGLYYPRLVRISGALTP
jgi:hypothetical protein